MTKNDSTEPNPPSKSGKSQSKKMTTDSKKRNAIKIVKTTDKSGQYVENAKRAGRPSTIDKREGSKTDPIPQPPKEVTEYAKHEKDDDGEPIFRDDT